MIELKDLLGIFEKLLSKEEFKTDLLIEILVKYISIPITKKDIQVKNGTLFLQIKPIYKSELYLHKEAIQNDIQALLGEKFPSKIR